MKSVALRAVWLGGTIAILTSALAVAAPSKRDRPRIAVLEFMNRSGNPGWDRVGAQAAQDVFVTELVKSRKFQPLRRGPIQALAKEKNLTLTGDVDSQRAVELGKVLGVRYLLTG